MLSYVINIPTAKDRLAQFQAGYPKCLPPCVVWPAKTGDDVKKPDWWKASGNRYALVLNFIDILTIALAKGEDVIIFEDDCIFSNTFETEFADFMANVPDDADMLYLGSQTSLPPKQVSENIMRLKLSYSGHAIIYKYKCIARLIDWYREPKWGCGHAPDQRRAQAMVNGSMIAYSPKKLICGQAGGYSYLMKTERPTMWFNEYMYIGMDGKSYNTNGKPVTKDTKVLIRPKLPAGEKKK